jgi:hypothetical protein
MARKKQKKGKKEKQACERTRENKARERRKEERGRETDMPKGLGTAGGAEGPVLYGDARSDDATVSRSLFPACLRTCKHSLTTRRAKGNGPGGPARPFHGDEIIAAGAYERKASKSRR